MMKNKATYIAVMVVVLIAVACGSSRQFAVRQTPPVARLNRIAVFPMENLSGVADAGSRVTSVVTSELYNSGLVNVVEPGEIQQFILRSRIRVAGQLDLDTIREASRQLNADGILFGSVNEYTVLTTDLGQLPAASMTMRLVDAHTGEIVWSVTHSLQGDFKETVFGIGRVNSLGTLSEIMVKDMIKALAVAMYPDKEREYVGKLIEAPRRDLVPSKDIEEPVIPLAPTQADLENVEAEREKAHSAVMQEWETIKGLSE